MHNDIENTMTRLMDGSLSSTTATPDPVHPPVVEKVTAIVERFIGKFGSVDLEIFRLPTSSSPELQRFLNSLQITLRRQGIVAAYAWQYHPAETAYYLLLFHTGSIHGTLSGVVHRLWHASPPITQLDNIRVTTSNHTDTKDWLVRSLLALGATLLSSPSPYYRHSYGSSLSV